MKSIYKLNHLRCAALVLIYLFSSANVYSQSEKTASGKEQTSFSSESVISIRVKIPADVLKQLSEYDNGRLSECQQDADLRRQTAAEHFAASKIFLDGDQRPDLIVQAQTPCFMGAHNTTFWLFLETSQKPVVGYKLIFDIPVDFLKILKTSTGGYRDIETASHTAVELYTIKWKFDGRQYQKSVCRKTDENNRISRIKCNF